MPAEASLKSGAPSLGLAHDVKLVKPVSTRQTVRWTDVVVDESSYAVKMRREMEKLFTAAPAHELVY